jgi:hypothetical protein
MQPDPVRIDYAGPDASADRLSWGVAHFILSTGLALTFMFPVIGAGHGAAPVGLIMFLGEGDWHVPMGIAWTGIGCLVASSILRAQPTATYFGLGSLLLLLIAWGLFVANGAGYTFTFTLVTSLPFGVMYAAKLFELTRRLRKRV